MHHQPAVDGGACHAEHLCRPDRVDAPPPRAARFASSVGASAQRPRHRQSAAGELALMAGADRVEGCLFGNGERTGNVDLVNAGVEPLHARRPSRTWISRDIDEIRRDRGALQPVAGASAPSLCRRPGLHGVLRFASGRDQEGLRRAQGRTTSGTCLTCRSIPTDLGRSYEAVIRVNSQSGKGGMAYLLESEYGLELPRRLQIEFSQVVQAVMDFEGKELRRRTSGSSSTGSTGDQPHSCAGSPHRRRKPRRQPHAGAGCGGAVPGRVGPGARLRLRPDRRLRQWLQRYHRPFGAGARPPRACRRRGRQRPGGGLSGSAGRRSARRVFGVGMDPNIVTASLRAIVSGIERAEATQRRTAAAA